MHISCNALYTFVEDPFCSIMHTIQCLARPGLVKLWCFLVPRPKDSVSYPTARATANLDPTTGQIRNTLTLYHGNDRARIPAVRETSPPPTDWTFRPDDHY